MTQRIEHIIKNDSEGDAGRKDKDTRKQIKKQTDYAKEAEKSRKTSLIKQAGVSISLGGILKQSQVFTSTLGTVFQLLGAFVDVIMAPFLPVVVPAIKKIASLLPVVSSWSKKVAETAIPKIKEYLAPLMAGIRKVATLSEGGFDQIIAWFVKLGADIVTKLIPKLLDLNMKVTMWLWEKIKLVYTYLKTQFPMIQEWEDKVLGWWATSVELWGELKKWAIKTWEAVTEAWNEGEGYWKSFRQLLSELKIILPIRLQELKLKFQDYIKKFNSYMTWLGENWPLIYENIISGLEQLGDHIEKNFLYYVKPELQAIVHNGKQVYGWFQTDFPQLWDRFLAMVRIYYEDMVNVIKGLGNDIAHIWENKGRMLIGDGPLRNKLFGEIPAFGGDGSFMGQTKHYGGYFGDRAVDFNQRLSHIGSPLEGLLSGSDFRPIGPDIKPGPLEIVVTNKIVGPNEQEMAKVEKAKIDKQRAINTSISQGQTFFLGYDVYGEDSDVGYR